MGKLKLDLAGSCKRLRLVSRHLGGAVTSVLVVCFDHAQVPLKNPAPASIFETPDQVIAHLNQFMAEAEDMLGGDLGPRRLIGWARSRPGWPGPPISSTKSMPRPGSRRTKPPDGTNEALAAGARRADHAVRAKPYQSLASALGVSVIVGLLIGRRDD